MENEEGGSGAGGCFRWNGAGVWEVAKVAREGEEGGRCIGGAGRRGKMGRGGEGEIIGRGREKDRLG